VKNEKKIRRPCRERAAGVFICSGRVHLMDEFLRISQRGGGAFYRINHLSLLLQQPHTPLSSSPGGVYLKYACSRARLKRVLKSDGQRRKCDKVNALD